jgi:hypothetical protein
VRYEICVGVFTAKLRRDNIFKLIIRDESPHQDSNDNGVRIVNFAATKSYLLRAESSRTETFLNSIFAYPYQKTHNQIDHILIDSRWHYSIIHIRYVRGADCDTDQCLVAAKFMESLVTNKTTT